MNINLDSLDDDEEIDEADLDKDTFDDPANLIEGIGGLDAELGHLPGYIISHTKPILQAAAGIMQRAQVITENLLKQFGEIQNSHLLIKAAKELLECSELVLLSAEMLIKGTEEDPECHIIASAQLVRAATSSLFAQFKSYGDNPDPQGILQGHIKIVQINTAKIQKKLNKIVRQKIHLADQKNTRKIQNKSVRKLDAQNKLSNLQSQLGKAEKELYAFRRKH